MKTFAILLAVSLFIFNSVSFSQIQLTGSGYAQDFNTLKNDTGSTSVLPESWYLLETGSSADGNYVASNGSTTGGNTYSYGLQDSTERALGCLRTGSLISIFGVHFKNHSGGIISSLHISYFGEQWRAGVKNRNEADKLAFEYSLDATGLSTGTWNSVAGLNLLSPNINASTNTLNGNSPENRRQINYTITGLSIPVDAEFWLRWKDEDISGIDDGLAVDDFFIDLTAPPVIFSIEPSYLSFDTVDIGSSSSLSFLVENKGTTDDLLISNIESSNPVFTFSSEAFPISISPGNSRSFNVTFTPLSAGAVSGTIDFTHNAEGSYYALPLNGTGRLQSQGGILKFKSALRAITVGTTGYRDTIVLNGYSGRPLKAIQFSLLIGKANGGLKLMSVARGDAIPSDKFNFSYEIYPGYLLPDSSSIDTIKAVILGNDTNTINPDAGSQDIIYFTYDAVSLPGDSSQTFNGLMGVKGATSAPVANANLSAGADQVINISAPAEKFGDINLDDHVDLLDILLMIDCILGRETLNADQIRNGDLFPWAVGENIPAGDLIIDVLDLAQLHNIVLTGSYPNNNPVPNIISFPITALRGEINKKITKVIFNFSRQGISIDLESVKKIKGVQVELSNVGSLIPGNVPAASSFSRSDYYQDNSFFRLLAYNDQSIALDSGKYLAAAIPFSLMNPEKIIIENIIVADEMNRSIPDVEVEIRYEEPGIPVNYLLSQNYPNPFNPATVISFSIPQNEFVTIKIYDIIGREVKTLLSEYTNAGRYILSWDGADNDGMQVSSGTYIYRMAAGGYMESKKMIYLK